MWSCGQQSAAVVGRCWIYKCVTDDYISSAAHEAALDVAHQPNDEVNVLGYDKDFVVVADIPPFADVQKGKQRGPSTAGRVRYRDEALHVRVQLRVKRNLGHAAAHIVGSEELPGVVVAQLAHHVQRTEEVLVWILLHAHDYLAQHFSHALPLLGGVFGNDGLVHLGALWGVYLVRAVRDLDGRQGDEVLPNLPAAVLSSQAIEDFEEVLLVVIPDAAGHCCFCHRLLLLAVSSGDGVVTVGELDHTSGFHVI